MKSGRGFLLVLVTAPDIKTGRKLARTCCESRLAACVNLLTSLESHYWWKGKLEKSREVLLLIKSRSRNIESLEAIIKKEHPFQTPEIIAVPVTLGSEQYLSWWKHELRGRS